MHKKLVSQYRISKPQNSSHISGSPSIYYEGFRILFPNLQNSVLDKRQACTLSNSKADLKVRRTHLAKRAPLSRFRQPEEGEGLPKLDIRKSRFSKQKPRAPTPRKSSEIKGRSELGKRVITISNAMLPLCPWEDRSDATQLGFNNLNQ